MRSYRHFINIIGYLTVIVLVIGLSTIRVNAQKQFSLNYSGVDANYIPKVKSADSTVHQNIANQILTKLRTNGYWSASIDHIKYSNDSVYFTFFQGRQFKEVLLELSTVNSNQKVNFQAQSLDKGIETQLKEFENHGYPFGALILDSVFVTNSKVQAYVSLDSGPLITNDSMKLSPSNLIKASFLSQYLGISYDQPYSEKAIKNISEKLQIFDFLELKSVQTSFQLKRAQTSLDLGYRKVNYFDGILGVVPNQVGGGVLLTGELNLSLKNLFKSGKSFDIKWEKLTKETQNLMAEYQHPQLLGSPLDFGFSYNQIKQDSSFSNRSLETELSFRPTPRWKIGLSYENKLGNNLKVQNAKGGDFQIDYYGIKMDYTKLNSRISPTKGWQTTLYSYIGKKDITTEPISSSIQYYFRSKSSVYFGLSRKSVLYAAAQGGMLINDHLFLNDLNRLGGLKTIRGFNEGEFFASKYAIMNVEWRFYTDQDSYLVTFIDQGFMSYDIALGHYSDQVTGMGAGFLFATNGGSFQLLYGLGKRKGSNFSFDSSKIHFGYSALF